MNDILLDPPNSKAPKPGDGIKQMGIVMALVAAIALIIGILIAHG